MEKVFLAIIKLYVCLKYLCGRQSLKYLLAILVLLLCFDSISQTQKEETSNKDKAIYLYNFGKFIEWPNFNELEEFRIGVLGNEDGLIQVLDNLAKTKLIGTKRIKIINFKSISEITQIEILYVDAKKSLTNLSELDKLIKKNTLLVAENCADLKKSMIAFIMENDKRKFGLNLKLIKKAELKANITLSKLALAVISDSDEKGNEKMAEEWKKSVFEKFKTALNNNSNELVLSKSEAVEVMGKIDEQKFLIKTQNTEIEKRQEELSTQKNKIEEQLKSILTQEQKIKLQEEKLGVTIQQNKLQQQQLETKKMELESKKNELGEQQIKIELQKMVLANQQKSMDEQKEKLNTQLNQINIQSKQLGGQLKQINAQQAVLYLSSGIIVVVIIALIFVFYSFRQKQKANIEITRQKEFIELKQKEILDSIHYARRIQRSLLTSEKYIERNLNKLKKS